MMTEFNINILRIMAKSKISISKIVFTTETWNNLEFNECYIVPFKHDFLSKQLEMFSLLSLVTNDTLCKISYVPSTLTEEARYKLGYDSDISRIWNLEGIVKDNNLFNVLM